MPLSSYTIMHWDAKLCDVEKDEIIKYLTQLKNDI
ncbi:MAG: heme-binding domain-containing protein [Maribacter sp.]|nr:heme-binding domain-containing protein [Maribacter sp.]